MFRKSTKVMLVMEMVSWSLQLWPTKVQALETNPIKTGIEALGPFPILQMGAALLLFMIIGIGSFLFLKGMKFGKGNEDKERPVSSATEVYFNGPLQAIFEALTDIKGRQLIARLEMKEDFAVLISASRHALADKLIIVQDNVNDAMADAVRNHETSMENRFRDANTNINSLHSRMDDVMRSLARLEANNDPPPRRK